MWLGVKNIVVDKVIDLLVELGWGILLWFNCWIFVFFSLFDGSVKIGIFGGGFLLWILKWKFEMFLSLEI